MSLMILMVQDDVNEFFLTILFRDSPGILFCSGVGRICYRQMPGITAISTTFGHRSRGVPSQHWS